MKFPPSRSLALLVASLLTASLLFAAVVFAELAAAIPAAAAPADASATTATPPSSPDAHSPDWDDPDDPSDHKDHEDQNVGQDDGGHRSWRHHHSFRHHGNDVVNIGDDSTLEAGKTADSVVAVFGDTQVSGDVRDGAVAVFGNTYVDSKIGGDAVAVFGNVELGPHADIGGNVVAVGGKVRRDPAAIIHGESHTVFGGHSGRAGWMTTWVEHCLSYGRPLSLAHGLAWAWGLALAFLALYVCLALVFRDGITRCVETFESRPGQSLLAGFISMLLTPVLIVVLCITLIGIAAVPFVVFGLFCIALFGKAVMLAWVGRRLLRRPGARTGVAGTVGETGTDAWNHPAVAVLVGGLLVSVVYLVPVIGFVVYKLLGFLGFGAVVYTLIGGVRARQATQRGGDGTAAANPPTAGSAPAHQTRGAAAAADVAAMAGAGGYEARGAAGATYANPGATAGPGVTAGQGAGAAAGAGAAPGPSAAAGAGAVPGASGAAGAGAASGTGAGAGPAAAAASTAPPSSTVVAGMPRAGFWLRMAALLLDVLLVGFITSVLHSIFHLHLVLLAIYGAVMWKLRGATIGGIVCDLRVVRLDGLDMDWETAIVRALTCFLSLAVAGLGFFWIAFDDAQQAWHDKIAGTVVVRVPKALPRV